jgi:hypothetical protein
MHGRRRFVATALGAVAGAGSTLAGCAPADGGGEYPAARERIWRRGPLQGLTGRALQLELIRQATLAPSSHNTQCWRFRLAEREIAIEPDFTRRCPVVDPDDHHLFVSLGCAAENLTQAALAHGLAAETRFDGASRSLRLALTPTAARSTPWFEAITRRQSTRGDYDGRPLAVDELKQLEAAAAGDGVRLLLLTEPRAMQTVLDWVVRGNTTQVNDPAFVAELKQWIRFSSAEAVRRGDGLYGASSGNPVMPEWLGPRLFDLVFKADKENNKVTRQLRSSAGVAIFVAPTDDPAGWTAVGRAFERFALQATAMDVRSAHLNMPIEVAALRADFAAAIGLRGQRPDLVIRFGRGPTLPPSLRRPVNAVLVGGEGPAS